MKKGICYILVCLLLCLGFKAAPVYEPDRYGPDNLIRFHVIANSDSEEDQLLKYAVRDAILQEVSPRLAKAGSIDDFRNILLGMERELLEISGRVVKEWGADHPVTLEYGTFVFPVKSYGDIVLPGGKYEAVEIKIGKAQGANWWCILFPPLCFVHAGEATTLPVDGKQAVPMGEAEERAKAKQKLKGSYKDKEVGFFFGKFLK